MTNKQQNSGQSSHVVTALRKKAEELARTIEPIALSTQTSEEIQRMLHELRVHQIELQMQNEELRTAQAQTDVERARYFDLYDKALVGYCTLSEKGLILEANLTAATLLDTTRRELVTQPLSRFIHNEDQGIYDLHRKKLLETGTLQKCDLRVVKPDGGYIWAHLKGTVDQAEDGASLCRVVLSDITNRKQAEDALRESEAKVMSILEGVPVLQFVIDREHRVISWNSAIVEYSGINATDIIGTDNHWSAFYPEKRPVLADLLVDGKIEQIYQRYDGKIRQSRYLKGAYEATDFFPFMGASGAWLTFTAAPIRDAQGNVIGAVETLEDITERRQAETALRQSEEKYRQLFHSIKDSILVTDTNRNIIDCNQAFIECFGYSKEEIIGRQTACLYVSKEEFLKMGKKLKDHLEFAEKYFTYNIKYKKKTGDIFPGETNAFFLKNDKNETIGYIGITKDITRKKIIEKSLINLNEELGRKAVELEDTNTALKVLLQKRDLDNLELQKNIYSNYELMIEPFINKLKNKATNKNQQNLINIIEINLKEIINPFIKKISNPIMSLTQSEIQIATMIKQGFTNKEIAETLNCSKRTIDTHRENIRKKLNITNKKINLKTFLLNS